MSVENYEALRVVGKGSFGKVYLVRHKKDRKQYVMKVIKLKGIPKKERDACRNEVMLMQRLRHPNIVSYKESFLGKRGETLCIVMTYCDGGDLSGRVAKQKRGYFSEDQVMHWFVQIVLGVHYMHEHKVLHRDIKCQNIFLLGNGRLVLGDLGISKVLDGTMAFAQTQIGTPYYMSPELFRNKPYNNKSDVWALGCVLYELAALKHPFDATSLNGLASKIMRGNYTPLSSKFSRGLKGLVKAMLHVNPTSRPTCAQLLQMPYMKKHLFNLVNDIAHRSGGIGEGTAVFKAGALRAAGGVEDMGLSSGAEVDSLFKQLTKLGLQSVVSSALEGASKPEPVGKVVADPSADKRVVKKVIKQQKNALAREEERRRAVEEALAKLRQEKALRVKQRQEYIERQQRARRSRAARMDPRVRRAQERAEQAERRHRARVGAPPRGGGREARRKAEAEKVRGVPGIPRARGAVSSGGGGSRRGSSDGRYSDRSRSRSRDRGERRSHRDDPRSAAARAQKERQRQWEEAQARALKERERAEDAKRIAAAREAEAQRKIEANRQAREAERKREQAAWERLKTEQERKEAAMRARAREREEAAVRERNAERERERARQAAREAEAERVRQWEREREVERERSEREPSVSRTNSKRGNPVVRDPFAAAPMRRASSHGVGPSSSVPSGGLPRRPSLEGRSRSEPGHAGGYDGDDAEFAHLTPKERVLARKEAARKRQEDDYKRALATAAQDGKRDRERAAAANRDQYRGYGAARAAPGLSSGVLEEEERKRVEETKRREEATAKAAEAAAMALKLPGARYDEEASGAEGVGVQYSLGEAPRSVRAASDEDFEDIEEERGAGIDLDDVDSSSDDEVQFAGVPATDESEGKEAAEVADATGLMPADADADIEVVEKALRAELARTAARCDDLRATLEAARKAADISHPAHVAPVSEISEGETEDEYGDDFESAIAEEAEDELATGVGLEAELPPPAYAIGGVGASGRLADRIRQVRTDCIAGLGRPLFERVYSYLKKMYEPDSGAVDVGSDDAHDEMLSDLLGPERMEYRGMVESLLMMENSVSTG